jgi:hypothetical protein
MFNRSRKLAMVEFNDMVFWVDPEELKGHDFATTLALSCLPLAMMAALLATIFCGWLFQGRRTLGSWTLAFKVSTRRIAQLFATSSPP